jgi:hypothetical protein
MKGAPVIKETHWREAFTPLKKGSPHNAAGDLSLTPINKNAFLLMMKKWGERQEESLTFAFF